MRKIGKLSLERHKGDRDRLIEMAAQSRFYFPFSSTINHFGTLITGRLMKDDRLMVDGCLIGGHLMEVQLYTEWDDNHVCIINQ